MYYCENCHLVCEGPVCPYCGSTSLRAPKGGDFCYLSTMVSPWGEAMQELLKEAGIRCLTRQARSVLYSVAFGQNHAELELFVPWEDLEQAASLQKSLHYLQQTRKASYVGSRHRGSNGSFGDRWIHRTNYEGYGA